MLAFLEILGAAKIHPTCDIPYKFPEPLDANTYTPYHVSVILRHGARTPISTWLKLEDRGHFECDAENALASRIEQSPRERGRKVHKIFESRLAEYQDNCNGGDLTLEGMEQHIKLGGAFRKYVIEKMKLIPEYLDPSLISCRATWYERTYRSGVSFLQGLYPVQDVNEFITFFVGSKDRDTVHPNGKMCPDLKELSHKWFASDEYMVVHNETMPYAEPLYNFTGNTDKSPEGLESMCDWGITYYCNSKNFKKDDGTDLITDEMIKQCRKVQAYHFYRISFHDREKLCIGGGPIFRQILKTYEERNQNGKDQKLDIIAAHDSVIAFILSSLDIGYDWVMTPPYASYITMEWYTKNSEEGDNLYVRFTYNGDAIKIFPRENNGGYDMMKFTEFKTKLATVLKNCPTLP